VVELIGPRAQADFNVGQAISVSQLREGHSKKLIPTREATDSVVAVVAFDAPAKLLRVNPLHDLRKNSFSSAHFCQSMARRVLKKPEIFPYRSHHFYSARHSDSSAFNKHLSSQPDDNERQYIPGRR
jgi:hypothetical protein